MNAVPEGWCAIPRLSPFNALIGPLYQRGAGEALSIGLHIEEKHVNSRGICHGGALATLADLALGYAMQSRLEGDKAGGLVTVQLSVDYAGSAKIGDWIESEVRIQRIGARLAFADCHLVAGGVRIVRASAIFARPEKE